MKPDRDAALALLKKYNTEESHLRHALAVEGAMTLVTQADSQTLAQGEAVFIGADERSLSVEGEGTLIQADVP